MDFVNLVQSVGVAVACLACIGLALWHSVKWLAVNVIKPLVDRVMTHIDAIDERMNEQSAALHALVDGQRQQSEVSRQQQRQIEILIAWMERQQGRVGS